MRPFQVGHESKARGMYHRIVATFCILRQLTMRARLDRLARLNIRQTRSIRCRTAHHTDSPVLTFRVVNAGTPRFTVYQNTACTSSAVVLFTQ